MTKINSDRPSLDSLKQADQNFVSKVGDVLKKNARGVTRAASTGSFGVTLLGGLFYTAKSISDLAKIGSDAAKDAQEILNNWAPKYTNTPRESQDGYFAEEYQNIDNSRQAAHETVCRVGAKVEQGLARGLSMLAKVAVVLVSSPIRLLEHGVGKIIQLVDPEKKVTEAKISNALVNIVGLTVNFVARVAFLLIEGVVHAVIYGGGKTIAFIGGTANTLNKIEIHSPVTRHSSQYEKDIEKYGGFVLDR